MGFESDGVSNSEMNVGTILKSSTEILSDLRIRCEELDDAKFMLESSKKEIEGQIDQCFQTITRCLEDRRRALLVDLDTSLRKRRLVIEGLMKDMEERSQKITITADLLKTRYVRENGSFNGDLRSRNEGLLNSINLKTSDDQLKKLLDLPIPIHPAVTDIVSYFPINLDKLLSLIKNFGAIGMTSVDSDRTSIDDSFDNPQAIQCTVNETVFRKVRAVDSQDRIVNSLNPKEFSVSLTHRPAHINETSVIVDESNSDTLTGMTTSVLLRLKIANPGLYYLNVKVLGEHIRGSPYRVQCVPTPGPFAKEWLHTFNEISLHSERRWGILQYIKLSKSAMQLPKMTLPPTPLADKLNWNKNAMIFAIGARGRGVAEFAIPEGAMFTHDSKLVIADSGNANVQVFDSTGAFLLRFGDFGSDPGQLIRPKSVAETINNNYLVCDFDLHCVHVFQPSGSYMSRFGQRNLAGPSDVAVDSKGKIYVVDFKTCTVCYFKPTGRFLRHFGARGVADHQFTAPTGIAISASDRVYVVDSLVHAVKVFENEGEFLFKFGVNGNEPSCLHLPTRIAIDNRNLLYIADTGNNRIQIFDCEGQYLWMLTTPLDAINEPCGVAVLPSEAIAVVVDTGNYRIKAFDMHHRAEVLVGPSFSYEDQTDVGVTALQFQDEIGARERNHSHGDASERKPRQSRV